VSTQTPDAQGLTIGDLAGRTGLAPATLRAWEARHGFPVPSRRASGHRRYDERDVALVRQVLRRREAGVRLDVAIADAAASRSVLTSGTTSVFAELRGSYPHLAPQKLRKQTLLALTWAMEDEGCARAQRARLFGAFQRAEFYRRARPRWRELARTAEVTVVLADFGADSGADSGVDTSSRTGAPGVDAVHLPDEAPMRREWALVCDAPDHAAALAAWEIPGQADVPDRDRVFEAVWTLDPREVRDAARVCARLVDALEPDHRHDWSALEEVPPAAPADLRAATALFQRMTEYLDRGCR
jgi:DICT domain-containing protein